MKEQWKDIVGWPRHQISNRGRIRALPGARIGPRIVHKIEFRRQSKTKDGYRKIGRGRKTEYYVHHLVLEAFAGPRPIGKECRHLDGDHGHNDARNLKWGTRKENINDAVKHGTWIRGERQGGAKLTAAKVRAIRAAKGPDGLLRKLAEKYGVDPSNIWKVRAGLTWAHVK